MSPLTQFVISVLVSGLCINAFKLNQHGIPETEFVVLQNIRYRQPVCVTLADGVEPCIENIGRHADGELQELSETEEDNQYSRKTLVSNEVREIIDFDAIEPSSIVDDGPEIREKTQAIDDVQSVRFKRDFDSEARVLNYHKKNLNIQVTKVVNSPITATLVAKDCLPNIDLPLCKQDKTVFEKVKDKVSSIVQAVGEKKVELEAGLSHKKQVIVGGIQYAKEGIKNKTASVVDKIKNVTQHIVDHFSYKKDLIVGGIVYAKEGIKNKTASVVQTIVNLKNKMADNIEYARQSIVNHFSHKKDVVVETAKGVIEKKKEVLGSVIEKKKEVLGNFVNGSRNVVQKLVDAKSKVGLDIADKKNNLIEAIANKKEKIIRDFTANKSDYVKHLAEKKIKAIKTASERQQELVSSIAAAQPLVLDQVQKFLGLKPITKPEAWEEETNENINENVTKINNDPETIFIDGKDTNQPISSDSTFQVIDESHNSKANANRLIVIDDESTPNENEQTSQNELNSSEALYIDARNVLH